MSPEEKLRSLGIELAEEPSPLGSYVSCVQSGSLLFLSGILPLRHGRLMRIGKVGGTITLAEAQDDARQVVINACGLLRSHLGRLDKVTQCIKLNGFVASTPSFTEQSKVLNAASDLLFEIFGERGRHARTAVGVAVLPLDAPVEIDFVFQIIP